MIKILDTDYTQSPPMILGSLSAECTDEANLMFIRESDSESCWRIGGYGHGPVAGGKKLVLLSEIGTCVRLELGTKLIPSRTFSETAGL